MTLMYIHTSSITIDFYGDLTKINCPSYSKILAIFIKSKILYVTFQSEYYITYDYDSSWKSFKFKIITGFSQNNHNIPSCYDYLDTIRVEEYDTIEYYYVFVEEIKSLSERRDSKINTIMEN